MKMLRFYIFLSFVVVSLWAMPVVAQEEALAPAIIEKILPSKRILMIGNSYTFYNDMPSMLQNMLNGDQHKKANYTVEQMTKGGAKLIDFARDKELAKKLTLGNYDVVILQEQSTTAFYTEERKRSIAAIKALSTYAKKNGASVRLFTTWPRKAGHSFYSKPEYSNFVGPKTPEQMGSYLNKYYKARAKENGVKLVSVGSFWQSALKKIPGVELYDPDSSHPNLNGSYLAALLMYNSVSRHFPNKETWKPDSMSEATQRKLIFTVTGK